MGVAGFRDRKPDTAFSAQARAVLTAQRRHREFERNGVDDGLLEVDPVVDDPMDVLGVGRLLGLTVGVGVQLGQEHRHRAVDRFETANTLALGLAGDGAGDQDALGHRLQP